MESENVKLEREKEPVKTPEFEKEIEKIKGEKKEEGGKEKEVKKKKKKKLRIETKKLKIKKEEKKIKEDIPKGDMDIKQASEIAKNKLAEALDKKPNSTISISMEGDEWIAIVEIIDEEYLPGQNLRSMSDTLGVYEVKLSSKGELIRWVKKKSRKRGDTN